MKKVLCPECKKITTVENDDFKILLIENRVKPVSNKFFDGVVFCEECNIDFLALTK